MIQKFFLEIDEDRLFKFDHVLNYFKENSNVYRLKITMIEGKREVDYEDIKEHLNIIQCKPNLYGLYVKQNNCSEWNLKYIGQRKSGKNERRFTTTLIQKARKNRC